MYFGQKLESLKADFEKRRSWQGQPIETMRSLESECSNGIGLLWAYEEPWLQNMKESKKVDDVQYFCEKSCVIRIVKMSSKSWYSPIDIQSGFYLKRLSAL